MDLVGFCQFYTVNLRVSIRCDLRNTDRRTRAPSRHEHQSLINLFISSDVICYSYVVELHLHRRSLDEGRRLRCMRRNKPYVLTACFLPMRGNTVCYYIAHRSKIDARDILPPSSGLKFSGSTSEILAHSQNTTGRNGPGNDR
jgi:hypothetical protein